MAICPKCGVQNADGIGFCGSCGAQMIAQQQPQPQQQYQQPPAPKKSPVVAIVVVVIVIVAVLAGAFMFLMGGGGGSGSPEGAFNGFVDEYNAGDASGALHKTDAHFLPSDEFNEAVNEFGSEIEGHVTVNNLETRYREDMTSSERDDAEDYIFDFDNEFGRNVEDYCLIDFSLIDDGDHYSESMLCIKVDGKWYLAFYAMFDYGGSGSVVTPLGLNDAGRTTTTFTMLVSSAPYGAMVDGTQFSFTHDNNVAPILDATVYDPTGTMAAWYTPSTGWSYAAGNTAYTLEYRAGFKIKITAAAVSSGDVLTISSSEEYFSTTTYTV